ncbi:ABC transporter permease [Candidatus Dependentiae bacterium]|nr:ABC transporter permease [Candidatus Dependentiae bacterium]
MIAHYLRITKELLITDLMLMKQKLFDTIVNTLIWVSSVTAIATYILPSLGITKAYSGMILIGTIASASVFECFGNTSVMVADLDGDRTISYQLTLPLPGWLLLAEKGVAFAIHSAVLTLFVLPIGKLIMGDQLVLSTIHLGKFILAYALLHLMCGFLGIIMIAYTASMNHILNVWTRFLFPLWFFGGSQFNWYTLKQISPALAYVNLANPITYAYESIKGASLTGEPFLSFWVCIAMMTLFSILFLYIGHRKIKQRLDYL